MQYSLCLFDSDVEKMPIVYNPLHISSFQVPAGQRINVTLLDFGRHNHNRSTSSTGEPYAHCHVYAILKEATADGQKSETICGGVSKERRSSIFTTSSNQLEVRLVTGKPSRDIGQFLIEYKGKF